MAKEAEFIQIGEFLNYTAGANLAIGDVVNLADNAIGICTTDIANGAEGPIAVEGVWELAALVGDDWDIGDELFWDVKNGVLTSANDTPTAGAVWADAGNTGDVDISEMAVTVDAGAAAQTFTLTVTNADVAGSEVWSVVGSEDGADSAATTAEAFTGTYVGFTIPAATGEETDWALGDKLYFVVVDTDIPAGMAAANHAAGAETARVKING